MQRFRGGLVFKAHRLCVSLNSRLDSNEEEEKKGPGERRAQDPRRTTSHAPPSVRTPFPGWRRARRDAGALPIARPHLSRSWGRCTARGPRTAVDTLLLRAKVDGVYKLKKVQSKKTSLDKLTQAYTSFNTQRSRRQVDRPAHSRGGLRVQGYV